MLRSYLFGAFCASVALSTPSPPLLAPGLFSLNAPLASLLGVETQPSGIKLRRGPEGVRWSWNRNHTPTCSMEEPFLCRVDMTSLVFIEVLHLLLAWTVSFGGQLLFPWLMKDAEPERLEPAITSKRILIDPVIPSTRTALEER